MAAEAATGTHRLEGLLETGVLDASALHRLADRLGAAHAAAAPADGATFHRRLDTLAQTRSQRDELAAQEGPLAQRAQTRRVRHTASDAEDILFDLAEPVTELLRRGLATEANVLANRYLDVTPQGATGWAVLPLFTSLRAHAMGDASLADAILAPSSPRLVAIGGLSGTGKSTLARLIGSRLGRAPGGRVVRSDVFRKRLAGLLPEQRLPPSHYTRRNDQETYEAIFESAQDHLDCGTSVVLDAVFMSRSERDVVEALASRARVPFTGIWLEAPERDRIARVEARSADASDATESVVREQSRRSVGEIHWHRIRTNRPIELIVAAARGALDRR